MFYSENNDCKVAIFTVSQTGNMCDMGVLDGVIAEL